MKPDLQARMLRVADQIKVLHHYKELVGAMSKLSDQWNASSAQMQKSLQTRNIDMLSRSILENRQQAKRMNLILERYERIMAKMGADQ